MTALRHTGTGEVIHVESMDGHGSEWEQLPDLPVDMQPELAVFAAGQWQTDLTQVEATLLTKIDNEAGAFRKRFITDVPGQQAVYLAKEQEALKWTPLSPPGGAPYLEAEAGVRGISMAQMAAMILSISSNWKALSVAIEAQRIAAKGAVTAADTLKGKQQAAAVNWEGLLP